MVETLDKRGFTPAQVQVMKIERQITLQLRPYMRPSDFKNKKQAGMWKHWAITQLNVFTNKLPRKRNKFKAQIRCPILNMLLRKRGENYMEQVLESTEYKEETEEDKKAKLAIEAIKKEREAKLALIKRAAESDWVQVTLEEMDFDIDNLYLKAMKTINKEIEENDGYVDKTTLGLINLARQLKVDKESNRKFQILLAQKMQTDTQKMKKTLRLDKDDIVEEDSSDELE